MSKPINNCTSLFSERFKALRKEYYEKQEDFAEAFTNYLKSKGNPNKAKISKSTVSYYENGKRKPDIALFVELANFFNVSYDFLLGRSEAKVRAHLDIGSTIGLDDSAIKNLTELKRESENDEDAFKTLQIINLLFYKYDDFKRAFPTLEDEWLPSEDIVFYIDQILEYYFLDSILHMAEKELLFEGKLSHDSFLNAVDLFANLESQRDSCKENFSHLVNGIFNSKILKKILTLNAKNDENKMKWLCAITDVLIKKKEKETESLSVIQEELNKICDFD